MGPAVLARALGGEVPYAVKVHGSALEYVVKVDPARFVPARARRPRPGGGVLVGSATPRRACGRPWATTACARGRASARPGWTSTSSARASAAEAAADLRELAARLQARPHRAGGGLVHPRRGAAGRALARLDPERDRHVAFVGKLIVSKGVDLLAAAWPLVLRDVPDARLVVVGFGGFRPGFERLLAALAQGDLDGRARARPGRARGRGRPARAAAPPARLPGPLAAARARGAYLAAAAGCRERVT